MRFQVSHLSRYTYSSPVTLDPHVLRMRPRSDGSQLLREFELQVEPQPVGWAEWLDCDGNATASIWFAAPTETLEIRSALLVETRRNNPFDFLIEARAAALPVQWSLREELALAGYRQRRYCEPEIESFALAIAYASGELTTFFLSELAREIFVNFAPLRRVYGLPAAPIETLRQRQGSCRDLALLYIEACRAVGLPARFASGYQLPFGDADPRDLHAWAEVYLPGGGWRGFDPTGGLAVADRHIVVAAAADPMDATPISGTLRGTNLQSQLEVSIQVGLA